jgi:hypothetical protein
MAYQALTRIKGDLRAARLNLACSVGFDSKLIGKPAAKTAADSLGRVDGTVADIADRNLAIQGTELHGHGRSAPKTARSFGIRHQVPIDVDRLAHRTEETIESA